MATRSTWIQHLFGGGWATDFSPHHTLPPAQGGVLRIPFLLTARNLIYELDGGLRKMPGTSALNGTAIGSTSTAILGLYDFWRQGTGGTPTQKRVVHAGTNIYADDADGTFASIKSGIEDGKVPAYATFDDLLIISSDSTADVPFSWDQTTFQNLAGSPPNFAFSVKHRNRHWAAGVVTTPSRLYFSVNLDPEDWTGSGSGSIDIDPNDGDAIQAIYSWNNELWVFKGPYKRSIHRITGSAPTGTDAFARDTFKQGLDAAYQHTVFELPNDLAFMDSSGIVRSLRAVENFGDYEQKSLSFPINRTLREELNMARRRYFWAATDVEAGYALIAITPSGQTTNTKILMMDYRFLQSPEGLVRWALWDEHGAASIAVVVDATDNSKRRLFAGLYDGTVYKLGRDDRTHASGALTLRAETPFLTYGTDYSMKTLEAASVHLLPKNDNAFTFEWLRDGEAAQSITTTTQGGSDVLGPWTSNQFTLDTSTLGGTRFMSRFIEGLEEGGEFRAIQYRIEESTNNSDFELHGIGAKISGGAESTEN